SLGYRSVRPTLERALTFSLLRSWGMFYLRSFSVLVRTTFPQIPSHPLCHSEAIAVLGWASCSNVHCRSDLSGRQRTSLVPCLNRTPVRRKGARDAPDRGSSRGAGRRPATDQSACAWVLMDKRRPAPSGNRIDFLTPSAANSCCRRALF